MMTMREQLKHYESKLRIDKENLDEDIAEFPSLYFTISDYYLDAVKHRKRLEQRLDRRFAEIASAIRRNAADTSVKITEAGIKNEVMIHPKYLKLKAKLHDAVYIQDRWSALKDAFLQKSFSLKGLVSLAVSEHYQSDRLKNLGGRRPRI